MNLTRLIDERYAWPTCTAAIDGTLGTDVSMTCVLPRGHAMDGHPLHRDPSGVEWGMRVVEVTR